MDIKFITQEFANELLASGECDNYKPLGKFWTKENNKFIGFDNETGECWTEEFDTKEECIGWLKDEISECWNCGYIGNHTVSITIYFKNGSTFDELIGYEEDENIENCIKEIIKDNEWQDEVKDYDYGCFCPQCLESLS